MTDLTEADEQPEAELAPAEYPEQIIRVNFPFEDYRTIGGHWTEWDEETRGKFASLIADTRPSHVPQAVAAFLADHDPASPPADPPSEGEVPGDGDGDGVDPDDDPSDPATELEGQGDDPTPVPEGAGTDHVDDATREHDVHTALKTLATATAWAEQHPEHITAMIAHETGDAGKGRKTVLHELRALQAKNAGQ